jgi:RNA polymerase sigma-70 factor (ECF subfamily)
VSERASVPTDADLVEAARGGDVAGFGELYRRYYATAMGVARSALGDWHAAEDAVQESFAIACRDLGRLRRAHKFASWLRAICRNVARGMAKSRPTRLAAEAEGVCAPVPQPSTDGVVGAVRQSVDRLPPSAREVVLLRYFGRLSYRQIAEVLRISPTAVRGRLARAKQKIERDLRQRGLGRES